MLSYSKIAASLAVHLQLAQPPVAVCFAESVPAGVESFTGSAPAGCRFWQEAATRVFATSATDHAFCSVGQHTHNLAMSPQSVADLADTLAVFADLTYVRPIDLLAIPVLASKPKYIVYAPLAATPIDPDVVLLFVRPDQTLILSEAAQQLEAGLPPAMGRPACAVIPHAANSGRSALSLGCCGARAYLDVLSNDAALYAIPGKSIASFADRIQALSEANGILTKFHQIRRRAIESGATPTIRESLAALKS